jgi:3D (Asp-Asp-Asp) domain-containing protein
MAMGTRLIVPGYNSDLPVSVLDRGGAIRGERLDIFFASHQKAIEWGTKDLAIIIETPNAPFAPLR